MNSQEIELFLRTFNKVADVEDPQKCNDDFYEEIKAISEATVEGQAQCDDDKTAANEALIETLENNKDGLNDDKNRLQEPVDECSEVSGSDGLLCYEKEAPKASKKMNKLSEDSRKYRLKYESDVSQLAFTYESCLIDLKAELSERQQKAQDDLKICLGLNDPPITTSTTKRVTPTITTTTEGVTTTTENVTNDITEDSDEFPPEEPEEDLHDFNYLKME